MKIGIPRSLLFYKYIDFTRNFFEELGADVIISDKTNTQTLNDGVKVTVDDACLPVKLFHGHVLNLKDRVDYIFVPRIMSLYPTEHICPKFGGLPELIKYSIDDLPELMTPDIDFYEGYDNLNSTIYDIGSYITSDILKIKEAYLKSLPILLEAKQRLLKHHLPFDGELTPPVKSLCNLRLLVVGHSYNLYDSYSNMNLFKKLSKRNIKYITPEMIDKSTLNHHAIKDHKRQYWTFSKNIQGLIQYSLIKNNIDGIIYLSSFACGIDSILIDDVQRIAKNNGIPFLLLTIDEHTGEAGINTRLDAYIDLLERRKVYESNLPSHG